MDKIHHVTFRCYYETGNVTYHGQDLTLEQIPKWIAAYQFTHPDVQAITVKVWTHS